MDVKRLLKDATIKIGIKKAKGKSNVLKELIDNPENMKLEAYIENEELVIRVKKKESL